MLRAAAVFAVLQTGAALASPVASNRPSVPQWLALTWPGQGVRYWVLPMLVWLGALLCLALDRRPAPRAVGLALLLVLVLHVPGEWHPNRFFPPPAVWPPPNRFADQALAFARAAPGTVVRFDNFPHGFEMWLTKAGG